MRGTTLAAPAAWAVAAAAALVAAETYLTTRPELEGTLGATLIRYAAAVGTFCPTMAVLGAKRPQDRGWQWVVLSLWVVLSAPAGQAWAVRGAGEFQLSAVWKAAHLRARWGRDSELWANALGANGRTPGHHAGRLVAVADARRTEGRGRRGVALLTVGDLANAIACSQARDGQRARRLTLEACRRWLAFRDGWGAFWGLRILNRINETAELSDWPVRLTWGGFAPIDGGELPEIEPRVVQHVEQTMDSLLRRFERLPN